MKSTKRYSSLKVVCPYYKSEEKHIIYCCGVQKDTALHLAFAFPSDREQYKEKYCEERYRDCRIAKMLEDVDA